MQTKYLTCADLIELAKTHLKADSDRMNARPPHASRSEWRNENPIDATTSVRVLDTKYKTRPVRTIAIARNGSPYDVSVLTESCRVVERFDLRDADADTRLGRYEAAQ